MPKCQPVTPATVLSSSGLLNTLVALVPDLPAGPVMVTLVNSAGTSAEATYTVTAPGPRALTSWKARLRCRSSTFSKKSRG